MVKKLILLPLLLTAACNGPAANKPASVTQGTAGERAAAGAAAEVRLAKLPDSPEGDSAAVAGVLRVEGACLYLDGAGSARFLIASTIPGARWDPVREVLVVPSGAAEAEAASYHPGERVTLGGSETRAANLSDQWVEAPAATCDTRRIWVTHSIAPAGSS